MSAPYDDLMDLATIGGDGTSVTRLAWSQPLRAAYVWLEDRCTDLGLDVEIDAAGTSSRGETRAPDRPCSSARTSTP